MTLLCHKSLKPGTHAIVIGIGRYPWLVGGKQKPTFAQNDGMSQLTSPPASARAFATWLLNSYENPVQPLASVDLLLSDPTSQRFGAAPNKEVIESATLDNVSRAIRDWAARSTTDDDLMVFFFSGHGISAAIQTTLLCEDYGREPLAPLSKAIDFTKLRIGLDQIPARRQCFFVDACRVATPTVLETYNFYGDPVITPKAAFRPEPRQAPVFQSTLAGALAYGRKGKPSYFTEALLRGFEGAATDDYDDGLTWWVQTDSLQKALPWLLRRVVDKPEQILPQAPASDLSRFPLHRLKQRPDRIPVDVSCDPYTRTAAAIFSCKGAQTSANRKTPSAKPWTIDLPEGVYTFEAEIKSPAGKGRRPDEPIRPHYRNIRIRV